MGKFIVKTKINGKKAEELVLADSPVEAMTKTWEVLILTGYNERDFKILSAREAAKSNLGRNKSLIKGFIETFTLPQFQKDKKTFLETLKALKS